MAYTPNNKDVYEIINEQIIDLIENGKNPWMMGWTCGGNYGAVSHTTGKTYSFLNQILIYCHCEKYHIKERTEFLTFNQVIAEGGKVKAGEKSAIITFWTFVEKKEKDEITGEEKNKKYPLLRYYRVFEVSQCDGIGRKYNKETNEGFQHDPIEEAENVISEYYKREKITLNIEQSSRAFYAPRLDSVTCPQLTQFENRGEYYSTLFHETTHSTGIETRLQRYKTTDHDPFGSDEYSKEELVAEMGAAYSLARLGIGDEYTMKNSAAYLRGWGRRFRDDKKIFVHACSRAEEAVKFIFDNEKPKRD